jgi:hypothetical protein
MPSPRSRRRRLPWRTAALVALTTLLTIATLATPGRAWARPDDAYWLSVGIGAGPLGIREHVTTDFGRFAAEMSVFLQRGARVYGARAASTDGPHGADAWDVGALAGMATPADAHVHVLVAGGLGYTSHSIEGQTGGDEPPRRTGLCVPVEAEVTYRPFYLVGIGGFAYASLRSGESAAAVGAVVQIGRLR